MWNESKIGITRAAIALGASRFGGPLSAAERSLVRRASVGPRVRREELCGVVERIRAGQDPLGIELVSLRSVTERRRLGQFLTPPTTVRSMVEWAISKRATRLVDPGCGSGRFTLEAIRLRSSTLTVSIDIDPLATLITRAALSCVGAKHAVVINGDFTTLPLSRYRGVTAFVGNPPYVRHHMLSTKSKKAAAGLASALGYTISSRAGLHAHFFLATALDAKPGDIGCFVTSSEWLDVNYGSTIRHMLLNGLAASKVLLFDPKGRHFDEAQTTTAITFFEVGSKPRDIRISTDRFLGQFDSRYRGCRNSRACAVPKGSQQMVCLCTK